MSAIRSLVVALAVVLAFPAAAGSRPDNAAPNTLYSLEAAALLGPDGTAVQLTVEPAVTQFEKVQVKVWPVADGNVETTNFFDVPATDGVATVHVGKVARLQRVQVRAHVKHGSQNVLEAGTVGQYRALGAVSTDDRRATDVGKNILEAGGNAFDAAAAILFTLNVTQPHLAGIGGASNIVLYSASEDQLYAIDARETAPAGATPNMFAGRSQLQISVNGYSLGAPGTLLAVERMLDRWGTMSLADALQPAIGHAENGITVGAFLARELASNETWKPEFPPQTKALFSPGGTVLRQGDRLVQPDLAKTFRLIASQGPSVLYDGEIARDRPGPEVAHVSRRRGPDDRCRPCRLRHRDRLADPPRLQGL